MERAISYIRKSFFAARSYRDLDDLNSLAQQWCEGLAMDRPWPQDPRSTVREAFEREAPLLMSLPATPFEVDERCEVSVGKTPYVRFDCNDYSVPHESVRCTAVVLASLVQVKILDEAGKVIARHERCYGKREVIEDAAHVKRLVDEKRRARAHRAVDRLSEAAPSTAELLRQLAGRGEPLGAATKRLLVLLDEYGSVALEAAVAEALQRGVPHEHAVRQVLERERLSRGQLPGLAVRLPDDPRVRDLSVEPHALEPYDKLGSFVEEDDETNENEVTEENEEQNDDC